MTRCRFGAWLSAGLAGWIVAGATAPMANATPAPTTALLLYDSMGPDGWVGALHVRMLANLLGHFDMSYEWRPVENYQSGDLKEFDAVFYLGTVYDTPLPPAFLVDVTATDRPVCWFKYNLWQLTARLGDPVFASHFGFRFDGLDTIGYPEVRYRGESFGKDLLDPDMGRTAVLDPARVDILATAHRQETNAIPYVLRTGRFHYVADSPFSFIEEEDRYLVFADLLHDILGIDHPVSHPALLRLEDVHPDYPAQLLEAADALLGELGVPYAVNLVPVHADPRGVYNGGMPREIRLQDQPEFRSILQKLLRHGAQILLHGYTHQYQDLPNPYSGLTGDDYEFFRVGLDAFGEVTTFEPVPEDSAAWAQGRVDAARAELRRAGFTETAWVTPHYTASALDSQVFGTNFSRTMQRAYYFDEAGNSASQFFPYPIGRDIYGQHILPENLDSLTGAGEPEETTRTVEDILRAARKARVIRDGWAGTFFHPFLDLDDLRALVEGLRSLGYEFVPITTEVPPSVCLQSADPHFWPGATFTMTIEACGSPPFSYQWLKDGVALPGATGSSWTIEDFGPDDVGSYTVRVLNAHGSVESAPIQARFLVQPLILDAAIRQGAFEVVFHAEAGLRYVVDYQDFLSQTSWSSTFPLIGQGAITNLAAPLGGLSQRFYRLRVE